MITDSPRDKAPVGRAVKERRRRVDELLSIDVLELQRAGLLNTTFDRPRTIAWLLGKAITILPEASGCLWISVGEAEELVELEETPCFFGGARPWFRCPGVGGDGGRCEHRRRILYVNPDTRLGCQSCLRLTYESRQRHRDRRYEEIDKPLRSFERAWEALWEAKTYKALRRALEARNEAFDSYLKASEDSVSRLEKRLGRLFERSGVRSS